MIKIRALQWGDTRFLRQSASEQPDLTSILEGQNPLRQSVCQGLPLRLRSGPDIYVAVIHGQILGWICLKKDGENPRRWVIQSVVIDKNSDSNSLGSQYQGSTFDVGSQLIHFAVNRYGADGVQTFLAPIPHREIQQLGVFKSCGFRSATKRSTYHLILDENQAFNEGDPSGFREFTNEDAFGLKALMDDGCPVEKRSALTPVIHDCRTSWQNCLQNHWQGRFFKRWVVQDPLHESLRGAVMIETQDEKNFQLRVICHPGWWSLYPSLLQSGLNRILKVSSRPMVQLYLYDYEKEAIDTLNSMGFQWQEDVEILVKDYWVATRGGLEEATNPIMLFGARKPSTA